MKVDGLLQEAIRFHRLGSLAEAERLYASILQQDPDHADALHLLGVMACKCGRYQAAMDCISKALAINPNAPEYYNSLGVVQQGIGNEAEAVGSYLQAIALKDDYIEPYSNLLRLRPAAVEVRFNLALVLHRQRRMDEAVTHYSGRESAYRIVLKQRVGTDLNYLGVLVRRTVLRHPRHVAVKNQNCIRFG